jgi:hypothetical protein
MKNKDDDDDDDDDDDEQWAQNIEPCGTPHFIVVHFETEFELRYGLVT